MNILIKNYQALIEKYFSTIFKTHGYTFISFENHTLIYSNEYSSLIFEFIERYSLDFEAIKLRDNASGDVYLFSYLIPAMCSGISYSDALKEFSRRSDNTTIGEPESTARMLEKHVPHLIGGKDFSWKEKYHNYIEENYPWEKQ